MKNTLYIAACLLSIGFVSCEPEFDTPIDENDFYTSGNADFSTYVALGNSLTAGVADGTLYRFGQENSYPSILAQQFELAGGGDFTQPLVNDNIGGLLLNGNRIPEFNNRLILSVDAQGNRAPMPLEGTPTTEVTTSATGPFNNMGVPGAKSFHLVAPGYGSVSGIGAGTANPYFARMATTETTTVLADAVSLNPTFFTLWIGNNDVLSYATSGGSGVDQTGNTDPSTYEANDITDPNVFAAAYSAQVDALTATASGGALINIPDVTSIPYFTTVPVNPIPLDAATAGALNAQFAAYNAQVLPGLVQFGVISAQEAAMRQINFSAGQNYPIMTDDDLTNIAPILQGPPFNLPAPLAGLLGQLRQVNDDDLIVLPASSQIGTVPDPSNPTGVVGVSIPLGDSLVLSATEQARVTAAAMAYNATIQALAEANDLAFVDARSALNSLGSTGISFDAGSITAVYGTGGAFSLDGVHLTPRGYAFAANFIIEAINRKYNATIPQVNIGNYTTITVGNNTP